MHYEKLIMNPEVLTEDFVPDSIPSRNEHFEVLKRCISPAMKGQKPIHVLLFGPSGSGKTIVAKAGLSWLQSNHVWCVYVNCREQDTLYAVLSTISIELRILGAEKIDTAHKLKAIEEHLKESPLVVVLDEADKLLPKERNSIVYALSSMGNTGLVCICEDKDFYYSLEESVKSRVFPTFIEFQPYDANSIFEILKCHCSAALAEGSICATDLKFIALHSSNNARIALEILRKAISLSEQDCEQKITKATIKLALATSNGGRKEYLLKRNEHFRIIYDIVAKNPGIMSGHLWKKYENCCMKKNTKSVAERTFSLYLRRLCFLSLLAAERAGIRGNVRKYHIVE
jgi:archaeal cell division control protein 6